MFPISVSAASREHRSGEAVSAEPTPLRMAIDDFHSGFDARLFRTTTPAQRVWGQ